MANLEFRVLGPFEVIGPVGTIELPSARQRAILALLVLDHGSTVSSERLIDEVWGDHPPATARHALTVHVGGLRRVIGPERIESASGGYRLQAGGGEVDLVRFEALAEEAAGFDDPARAAQGYAAALRLWRGPALADLAPEGVARSARARLDARRTRVTELWLDAELAAGRHADLVPVLRRLVAEEPLREAVQARLMLALYRSGRQAEALAVYHAAREVLDQELGIEPGPELEALQQAVLAHDPQLQLADDRGAVVPTMRPASVDPTGQSSTASIEAVPVAIDHAPDNGATGRGGGSVAQPEPLASAHPTRRTVTALVAEISGSSTSGAPDPEAEPQMPAADVAALSHIVEHHGGRLEPLMGHAVLGVFGIPVGHEDDALRAVRAAVEMRDAVAAREVGHDIDPERRVGLHIGISTGEIVTGETRDPLRLIAGDVVNVAAGLVRAAAPGEIVLAAATYQLIRHSADAVPSGSIALRGRSGPLATYRLQDTPIAVGGHQLRLDSPLVGRRRELGQLQAALEQAIDDASCALFTLLGPAGVGKSRLVHEFLQSVRPDALVLRGRCLPYGEQVTFWPIAEVVRAAAGIGERDDASAVRAKIEALLHGGARAPVVAERVASAIGLSASPSTAEETTWAIRSFLEHLAHDRALVLVLDDLQWAEPALLDLLESIAEAARDAPILLLCIARPELLDTRPGWGGGKLNAASVLLKPLNEGEVAQLLGNLLGGASFLPAIERTISAAAEGNPLFVEEFLAMLVDEGVVRREDATWAATTDLATVAIPGSIIALLSARLDHLPPTQRGLLERASVVGKVFGRNALAALSDELDGAALDAALGSLERRELIRPDRSDAGGPETYRFKHILIRDAAYAGLPKRERIGLHERLAGWLAASPGEAAGLADELIGAHLEQAYRYRVEI